MRASVPLALSVAVAATFAVLVLPAQAAIAPHSLFAAAPPAVLLHADVGGRSGTHRVIPVAANTYVVNSTGNGDDSNTSDGSCNDGTAHCTLRAAIEQANASSGSDEIDFSIGTGAQTIQVPGGVGLPPLTDTITIDGTTQPGYTATNGHPEITIDGLSQGAAYSVYGLQLDGDSDAVIGLDVVRFTATGIYVGGAKGSIQGCYVGVDRTGALRRGNSQYGVELAGSDGSLAPTSAGVVNVISANGFDGVDVDVDATGNVVAGALVGLTADGMAALGNYEGIAIGGANTVGEPGEATVVSGNTTYGIHALSVAGTVVQDVYVGTNPAGTAALGNADGVFFATPGTLTGSLVSGNLDEGVLIGPGTTVTGNFIGTNEAGVAALGNSVGINVSAGAGDPDVIGGAAGAGNLISGNGTGIFDASGTDTVEGNYVGTDVTGTSAVPNGTGADLTGNGNTEFADNLVSGNTSDGLHLKGDSHLIDGNHIGTTAAGAALPNGGNGITVDDVGYDQIGTSSGNTIADNAGAGIAVIAGQNTTITGNSIVGNGGLGIDVGTPGITPNDTGDGDTGPNGLQNFPTLTSAHMGFKTATLKGSLNSQASSTYRLDFYDSPSCDSSGNGEGATWLGSTTITTDSGGDVIFSYASTTAAPPHSVVTATATDADGSTSEFSPCATVTGTTASISDSLTQSQNPIPVGTSETYTVTIANAGPNPAHNVVLTETVTHAGTILSATPSQGSCTEPTAKQVKCAIGTVASGATATVAVKYSYAVTGTSRDTAKVTSGSYDPDVADDTAVVHTRVT